MSYYQEESLLMNRNLKEILTELESCLEEIGYPYWDYMISQMKNDIDHVYDRSSETEYKRVLQHDHKGYVIQSKVNYEGKTFYTFDLLHGCMRGSGDGEGYRDPEDCEKYALKYMKKRLG